MSKTESRGPPNPQAVPAQSKPAGGDIGRQVAQRHEEIGVAVTTG